MGCSGWFGVEGCSLQNPYDLDRARSVSGFDVAHMLAVNWIYQLPFGKGRRHWDHGGLVDALFGGWQVSGVFQITSGSPLTLLAGQDQSRTGLGEDRAVFDECIDTIVKQVGDLKFMVNEFSNFARLPATTPKRNDLNRVIREATVLFAEGHKRIHFDLDLSDEVPEFDFDAEQIKRVLTNIFDNALDAIEGKGNVQVATRHNALLDLVRLEISNDGRPIPTEMMGRLFEPYFSTKRRGTGLGLAIVKTIINDHAGYIRVRPNRPRGTTFTIELPVKAAA